MLSEGENASFYHQNITDYVESTENHSHILHVFENTSMELHDGLGNLSSTDSMQIQFYDEKHPAIGVLLSLFSLITILGNLLVIIAVVREVYLRTVTNYLIVSLAIADVMVGGIVMPFSISHEMTNQYWMYGEDWCDLWHSFDVLASTASILNLCVISLDRYWAITDPIAYPTRMSTCRVSILITFVWLCSAGISFPAIAWWKAVTPPVPANSCFFTEDSAYLIFSSMVSFYCPTFVMIFVYIQIYRAASEQTKSIKTGRKVLTSSRLFGPSGVMTLRIHRGGMAKSTTSLPETQTLRKNSEESEDMEEDKSESVSPTHSVSQNHHHSQNQQRPMKFITKRLRQLALSKKITKLAKEQKAAKTLGIVVGVFIMCWLPFFVFNVLYGICHLDCVSYPDIVFPVFTWLGYINSGMNPVIYACSMRDFRRAFGRILFACCPKYRFKYGRRRRHTCRSNVTTSSFISSGIS